MRYRTSFTNDIKVPKSTYPEDWSKSEAIITKEHVLYCHEHQIDFWHTKVKGEPHMGKNGLPFTKKAANSGFFDMIFLFDITQ